jgi:GNAT superfamily N-acetyltransferase
VARLSAELGYPAVAKEIASRFAGLSGRPAGAVFVAETSHGEVIGWIHVSEDATLTDGPIAEIRGLVVDSRTRGRGVGRALVDAAENWAGSRGYPRVRVRSRVVREDAHRFYASAGYSIAKTQHVFDKLLPTGGRPGR